MGTKRVGFARIRSLINENTNQLGSKLVRTKSVTADTTLSEADSGSVILITGSGIDVTLPAATAGMTFTLIQTNNYSTTVNTVVAAAGDFFTGQVAGPSAAANNNGDGSDDITATFGTATVAGDQFTCVSDGTLWYVTGTAKAGGANGIAFS
jgi:hypothetical protein